MSTRPRVRTPASTAQVALAALTGDRTPSEIAAQYQVRVTLGQAWKKQMPEQAAAALSGRAESVSAKDGASQQAELCEQSGRLTMALEWVKQRAAAVR